MCQQKVFSPVFPEVCIQKERDIFSPDHEMLLLPPFHSNYAACDNIPVYGNPDIPVFLPDDFMEKMMEGDMFDVLGRKNKRQGGYMELLAEPRMPLIFANFNGTSGDVDVITHECGHAFQFYLAAQDDIREHWDITMETAETHSMSMEFFTNPWMEKFFDERAQDFRDMQLEDAICFIPYGCMVDEFQHIIFENPDMTPKERHQVWLSLEKQYRPYLCLEDVAFFAKGAWWQKQHHIYSMPFYYIDYCIAQVCALQYKIWMQKD